MTFKRYLEQGKLKKINAKFDQVFRLLKRAKKDISTAEKIFPIDAEWAYAVAYHSMLRSARALLLAQGLRPDDGAQHRTVVEVSGLILGEEFKNLIEKFDNMRKTRSDFIYESRSLSQEESKRAIQNAKVFIEKIVEMVSRENPQIKLF